MADGPDRNCTHLAGEYFVAAELYKRGYSVAITLGNAKAIDLYVRARLFSRLDVDDWRGRINDDRFILAGLRRYWIVRIV